MVSTQFALLPLGGNRAEVEVVRSVVVGLEASGVAGQSRPDGRRHLE